MRAEDLFEAIGALDEQLIALSEEDGQRAREAGSQRVRKEDRIIQKKRKRAEIYRFAAIAMTTAAAVFVMLTAKDLITTRSRNFTASAEYSVERSAAAEEAQDTLAGGAAGIGAEAEAADDSGPVEEAAESEAQAASGSAPDNTPAADSAEEQAMSDANMAEKEAAQVPENVEEAVVQNAGKTAVDLLGDLKGNYVKLEIISAEDKANGREPKEPAYSLEWEEALTAALEEGQRMPTMFVKKGDPVYYVYLTDNTGKVDTVTFYENGYVGINTIPSFVMKIPDEAFDALKEMFN